MSTDPFSTLSQVRLSEPPCYLFPVITTAECLCSQVLCFPTPVLRHWCAPRFQGQEEVVSGTWSQFLPRRGVTACPPSLHSLLYFYPHWACFASLQDLQEKSTNTALRWRIRNQSGHFLAPWWCTGNISRLEPSGPVQGGALNPQPRGR